MTLLSQESSAMNKRWMAMFAALMLTPAALAAQERSVAVSVRGGINVPTFDITDIAETGPGFGFGVQAPLGDRLFLRGAADFGTHGVVDAEDVDVKVNHYIVGLGLPVVEPTGDSRWMVSVNAGGGLMSFDADGASETNTYFAINVGGEIEYALSDNVSLLLSPQGDIAFVDEADGFTGSTAWVWPFTAGAKFRF
jgi:hypothetical protein